jgi:hypothetical protein
MLYRCKQYMYARVVIVVTKAYAMECGRAREDRGVGPYVGVVA